MTKKVVIVESPAKARTISQYLDGRYTVMASVGHVRDLPKSKLGINIDKGFAPSYVIPKEKQKIVKELKKVAADASALYLATDPDREGEAISWHLVQAIAPDKSTDVHRVIFQEITKDAVTEAFSQPRQIDLHLVNAQQARRILDRLVGYKISPLLWKKVRRGLSAGRVQSAVLKMIVDRERQIEQFVPVEYWNIEADLAKAGDKSEEKTFKARLFGTAGKANKKFKISNKTESRKTMQELQTASFEIAGIKHKESHRQPAPPFITSTLQQEAWRKLKIDSKRTMALAQQLYEGLPIGGEGTVGLITYMRTDSTRVSAAAVADARRYIADKYGSNFVPNTARAFSGKSKGTQDAHEAIRPTSIGRDPQLIKSHLTRDQYRLYELIWKRMVASQMSPALIGNDNIDIHAIAKGSKTTYLLRTASSKVKFAGYLLIYSEGTDDTEEDDSDRDRVLPQLNKGEVLKLIKLTDEQRFTQPPPRYTESTIIKALEENGIGRPSTYAPILSIIQSRGYAHKDKGNFVPEQIGILVNDLLNDYFADIVSPGFTAHIESDLDAIASGEQKWVPVIEQFYETFDNDLKKADKAIEKVKIADEPTDEICDLCGSPMVIKQGRYGRFAACSAFPKCKNTKSILQSTGVKCPQCGEGDVVERRSKKGKKFYGCSMFPKCNFTSTRKPKATSEVAK